MKEVKVKKEKDPVADAEVEAAILAELESQLAGKSASVEDVPLGTCF